MENQTKMEKFLSFKDRAIDFEEGKGFCKNISYDKKINIFYNKRSFILFKIIKVEDINTCYIYYMYGDDLESFKNCFYTMLNYCLGMNVKFIYYSEKEKVENFYVNFLQKLGFKKEKKNKKYKYDFICKKCGKNKDECTCKTHNLYI